MIKRSKGGYQQRVAHRPIGNVEGARKDGIDGQCVAARSAQLLESGIADVRLSVSHL